MAEYKTDVQTNYGFGLTFDAAGRAPVIAKRIWETLADAQAYIDDMSSAASATPGLVLTVINDGDNNGAYYVESTKYSLGGEESGVLVKVGSGAGTITVETIDEAYELATADTVGQIIYVTTATDDYEGSEYSAGPYIVTGDGTLYKLSIADATDVDVTDQIIEINASIDSLESDLSDLETTVSGLALGDENVIESITVNDVAVTISDKNAAITFTDTNTTYTIVKLSVAESGNASSYQLQDGDGTAVGATINIPLDQVLSSAEIKTVETEDEPYTGAVVGDKYIEFEFQNSDTQYLPVQDLVDVYTEGDYIDISSSNVVSLDYSSLKTQLSADLGIDDMAVIETVDTTASSGVALTYSNSELGVAVDVDTLKTALAFEDTDTTYDAEEGGHLTLSGDNEFSVDVSSLTVSLVSDETEGGVGSSLSALATRVTSLEGVSIPTYSAADDTIVVAETEDGNFTLKVDVSNVNTDTTYTALTDGNLTLSDDNEFSVDVAALTVALVTDTTTDGVGAILATKADADDLETLEGSVETLSDTVDALSEAMTWGSIVEAIVEEVE